MPISVPWEINRTPALVKNGSATATTMGGLSGGIAAGLSAGALTLSRLAGFLESFFRGRRTSRMKPVDMPRKL
jgi:hypothetical protein